MNKDDLNLTGNWTTGNYSLPQSFDYPVSVVDQLADELITALGTDPKWKPWYCKLIYKFGTAQVQDWKGRALDSKYPGKLFSKLGGEALKRRENLERLRGLREQAS